ncbi:MAG: hypothetical protein ACRDNE_19515 [Gaiellaceae bacterium]
MRTAPIASKPDVTAPFRALISIRPTPEAETIDLEGALELVREHWAPELERALEVAAARVVADVQARADDRERKASRARAVEAEHKRIARDAGKAHRKLYGRPIAKQLNPHAAYTLLRVGREVIALSPERLEAIDRLARRHGVPTERIGSVQGYRLGSVTKQLDRVDPDAEELEAHLREGLRLREAAKAKRDAEAKKRREREREEQTYGVAVGGLSDEG